MTAVRGRSGSARRHRRRQESVLLAGRPLDRLFCAAQAEEDRRERGGAGDSHDAADGRGGSWATDDNIYFVPTNTSGIWRAPAAGGAATEVTHPDAAKGEISHFWPQVLPGHQTMLFAVRSGPGPDEHVIVSQSLASGERRVLVTGGDMPRAVPTGHLIYGRFDGSRRAVE